jgi:hypothetical protein
VVLGLGDGWGNNSGGRIGNTGWGEGRVSVVENWESSVVNQLSVGSGGQSQDNKNLHVDLWIGIVLLC